MFTEEYLNNPAFQSTVMSFTRQLPEKINGVPARTGAMVQQNGDIAFRFYAPEARHMELRIWKKTVVLKKQADGIWTGLLPYDPAYTGLFPAELYVDGTLFLSPYLPVYWQECRSCNYVEIPDHAMDFTLLRDVPHGAVSREVYKSTCLNEWVRCLVYTPPGYQSGDQRYPVLYLQNGSGNNEWEWLTAYRVQYILDNLIAEGKITPFIVVMNNGMLRYEEVLRYGSRRMDDAFERTLCEDCIPFIDRTYRTKTDKWNRALAGLSMGAMMTAFIGPDHPELFGYLGMFTAAFCNDNDYPTSWKTMFADPQKVARDFKILWRSSCRGENHFEFFEGDDAICTEMGIDQLPCYRRKVYPEPVSKWNSWRLAIRDFAQEIFK